MVRLNRFLVLIPVYLLLACEATGSLTAQQIYMQTEDSHPHEVLPGHISAFPFWKSKVPGYVDVKCVLTGDKISFEIRFSGIEPTGWAAKHSQFLLGPDGLHIDIEGVVKVAGATGVRFDFINTSPRELLWHQCYNN